jgi:4-hydroxybenzoate polyprenyltransferase
MNSESHDKATTRPHVEQQPVQRSFVGSGIVHYLVSLLRLYRVSDWLHFLGFTLLGVIFASQPGTIGLSRTIMILAASAGLLGYAYSLNEFYDQELERSHRNGQVSGTGRNTSHALFLALPLLGSFILLLQLSVVHFAIGVLFSILWTMYSCPVLRLKAFPVVCTMVNGVGFPVLFLMGFVAAAAPTLECILIFVTLVLLEIPAQLIHEICHVNEDRLFLVCTTAVRYGEERAIDGALIGLLGVLVLVSFMLIQGILGLVSSLALLLFASIFAVGLMLARGRRLIADFGALRTQYKYAGTIAGVAMAISTFLHL